MIKASLLGQVGLIANIKLHFFYLVWPFQGPITKVKWRILTMEEKWSSDRELDKMQMTE